MASPSTTTYDAGKAFARIEHELIASMMRNLERHKVEEVELGIEWAQWQALQIANLEQYVRENALRHGKEFDKINAEIEKAIANAYDQGGADAEAAILKAIGKGWEPPVGITGSFFGMPEQRIGALIAATHGDLMKAEHAVLRRAQDIYRETIFDAQVYAASGAGTYAKAIDMATSDFLHKGIDCITYSNGSKHTIQEYAAMAVRTAVKRAAFVGEGDKRKEWGVHTVFVNYRTDACADCMEFCGEVLIDDVYSGGTEAEAKEGGYTLVSEAMDAGLFHPNCRDTMSTWFEGVNDPPHPTQAQKRAAEEREQEQQAVNNAEANERMYDRLAEFTLDEQRAEQYAEKAGEWSAKAEEVKARPLPVVESPAQSAIPLEEQAEAYEWYVSGEGMHINGVLRGLSDGYKLYENEADAVRAMDELLTDKIASAKLYRNVDIRALGVHPTDLQFEQMQEYVSYGAMAVPKNAVEKIDGLIESAVGKEITDKGFMSTTKSMDIATDWWDFTGSKYPIVLEFKTSGNTVGVDMAKRFPKLEERMYQEEVTLARGTRYKVTGYRQENGVIVYEAEILPDRKPGKIQTQTN